ncbi:MAG: pre-peptidase C-terminal domain-containing protein, partial [Chloroflexota bacterium]
KAQAKREAEARQRSTSFDFNDSDFAMDDAKEDGFSLSLSSDNDVDFASAGTPRKKKKSGGGGVALAIILGGLGICIVIPIAIIVILALLGPTIGEEFERIIEEEGLTTLSSGSIGEYNSQGNISVGQSMNGNVDTFTDDGWQFEGASGQSITVEVLSRSDLDPQLFIYGPDNMLIAENDDISMASGNFNSRVTVTLPTSGRYIFVVSAFGSGGAYEIRVS